MSCHCCCLPVLQGLQWQQQRQQQQAQQEEEQQQQQEQCQQQQLELQALTATALYHQGGIHAEAARSLMFEVLQQSPQQETALKLYAQIAADDGQWATAAKVRADIAFRPLNLSLCHRNRFKVLG